MNYCAVKCIFLICFASCNIGYKRWPWICRLPEGSEIFTLILPYICLPRFDCGVKYFSECKMSLLCKISLDPYTNDDKYPEGVNCYSL